jgi:hypothetical protein
MGVYGALKTLAGGVVQGLELQKIGPHALLQGWLWHNNIEEHVTWILKRDTSGLYSDDFIIQNP